MNLSTIKITIFCFILFFIIEPANGQKRPELTPTPPMGWNSWNYFGKQDINEKIVYQVIDSMVSSGLRDAGYRYVVIDGGWRDEKLAEDGKLLAHPTKFPNGIKPLADYAHSKGLKLGLHTVPGTHDCGNNPVGGYNKEEIHVKQFVDWGIDFVKLDLCKMKADPCNECSKGRSGWSDETIEEVYKKWSRLLNSCGRDIVFSVSTYKFRSWNPEFCNMSRTSYDILSRRNATGAVFNDDNRDNSKSFLSVMACAEINNESAKYAGSGYWNDPDMLVTGNQGLTKDEEISHFVLWAIMNAPLILGNDPRNMNANEKKLLLNKEIIAINQDKSGQGTLVIKQPGYQVWKKKMSDGSTALLLLNLETKNKKTITANFTELGLKNKLRARDVIMQKDIGIVKRRLIKELAPHASSLIMLK